MDTNDKQFKDDVHLIAAPFRFVRDLFQVVIFILILPLVFLINFVYWMFTGVPIMSPDECDLAQIVLGLLSPLITTFCWMFYKHVQQEKDYRYEMPLPAWVIFIATAGFMLLFVKGNFYYGWGLYGSDSVWFSLFPIWVPFTILGIALAAPKRSNDLNVTVSEDTSRLDKMSRQC